MHKDKRGSIKKFLKFLIIITIIILVLLGFSIGSYFLLEGFFKSDKTSKESGSTYNPLNYQTNSLSTKRITPITKIIEDNTDSSGNVNKDAVIEQAVLKFDLNYIGYILGGLGVSKLESSMVYGNPRLELALDGDSWNCEIDDGKLIINKGSIDDEDLVIEMNKEEAVKAIMSDNIKNFMKESVKSGNTNIIMVAGKTELYSKGYLDMYNSLK
jgi:hypothetical protein